VALSAGAAAKKFTLVIDAGHGGSDAGAIGAISKEKNLTLKYALAFGQMVLALQHIKHSLLYFLCCLLDAQHGNDSGRVYLRDDFLMLLQVFPRGYHFPLQAFHFLIPNLVSLLTILLMSIK
jgi:hypothetical protein